MEISIFSALLHACGVRSRSGQEIARAVLAFALGLGFALWATGAWSQEPDVRMPPDEFIHPFQGKVALMYLPHRKGDPFLSLSSRAVPGTCAIWLPKIGDPDITQALYECLAVIEIANCNGATDVNLPAVKARASFSEQKKYDRTCVQGTWTASYRAVGFE